MYVSLCMWLCVWPGDVLYIKESIIAVTCSERRVVREKFRVARDWKEREREKVKDREKENKRKEGSKSQLNVHGVYSRLDDNERDRDKLWLWN